MRLKLQRHYQVEVPAAAGWWEDESIIKELHAAAASQVGALRARCHMLYRAAFVQRRLVSFR